EEPGFTTSGKEADDGQPRVEEILSSLASVPRRTIKYVPIPSYSAADALRSSNSLSGERIRLTCVAEVKRSVNGVYAAFASATGRRIATVAVINEDTRPLGDIEVGGAVSLTVNLETTVRGSKSNQLALAESMFLPPEMKGFEALLEEPSPETADEASVKKK